MVKWYGNMVYSTALTVRVVSAEILRYIRARELNRSRLASFSRTFQDYQPPRPFMGLSYIVILGANNGIINDLRTRCQRTWNL